MKFYRPPHNSPGSRGFSLLELSIVITIISVVALMGLEGVASYMAYTAKQATEDRLKTIDTALVRYRYIHGRLPCPAALNNAMGAATYAIGQAGCAGATTINGGVSSVSVTGGGTNYAANGFAVPFIGGSGYGATAIVGLTGGALDNTKKTVPMGGYGYLAADTLTLDVSAGVTAANSPTTPGAPTATGAAGSLAAGNITITAGTAGAGYFSVDPPTAFPVGITAGGSTSGALAKAYIDSTPTKALTDVIVTNPGYGFTGAPTLDAATASNSTTAATLTATTSIFVGGLPVRDLGLPLSYALDAYGSKLLYYVTGDLTNTATFRNASGNIQVRSGPLAEPCLASCKVETSSAAYAVISVGRDQRGGYNHRGVLTNNCIPSPEYSPAIDAQNCMFEGSLANPIVTFAGVAVPAGVIYHSDFNNGSEYTNYTDDLVISRMKSGL